MDFKVGEILLGGNLNYVCDSLMDKANVTGQPMGGGRLAHAWESDRPALHRLQQSKLLNIFETYDTWRSLYPSARQFSFFSHSSGTYSRIDFILTSTALFNSVVTADIGLRSLSDHA